jgi:hypothetical protein
MDSAAPADRARRAGNRRFQRGTAAALACGMLRFGLRLALPLLLVAAVMNPAHADEGRTSPALPIVPLTAAPAPEVWYGWQVLVADAAALGLTVGCFATDSIDEDDCVIPLVGYIAAGPIVHATHAGAGRALASVGMRLVLPLVGGVIGLSTADCTPNSFLCGLSEMGLGMMAGTAAAVLIDSIWAFEDAGGASSSPRPRRDFASLTPTMKLSGQSTTFGLAGRF